MINWLTQTVAVERWRLAIVVCIGAAIIVAWAFGY